MQEVPVTSTYLATCNLERNGGLQTEVTGLERGDLAMSQETFADSPEILRNFDQVRQSAAFEGKSGSGKCCVRDSIAIVANKRDPS